MLYDPDFIVILGGIDATQYIHSWELHDVESGISNLSLTLMNPNLIWSGMIQLDDPVIMRFGYMDMLAPKIIFKVKKVSEIYGEKELYYQIMAQDCLAELISKTLQSGGGGKGGGGGGGGGG
jgi:hypothetical protein